MKISKSKQELARIISENGGWCGAANLALFGKVSGRCYMLKTDEWPEYDVTIKGFYINARDVVSDFHASPFTNWHQTILSRDEYFHLYPAPDADGWIEWRGGECPVDGDVMVLCKVRTGKEFRNGKKIKASILRWRHTGGMADIIAYRLHKPEQSKPELCESVVRSIPEPDEQVWTNPPSIEQLAVGYRNAKDCADRKQQEADAAKADSDEKLRVLELAGEALGLLVSPITAKQEPELVIADWRDLKVGDEVDASYRGVERVVGSVLKIDVCDSNQPIFVSDGVKSVWATEFHFIRRP